MDTNRARGTLEVERLFDEWYPYLVRYGRRICREPAMVEDCIQQVMLLLFREILAGAEVPNPKAWTLLVLRRELLRSLRRERLHVVLTDQVAPPSGPEENPGVPVEPDSVDSFLALLSPREAEVLLLRMNGLKYREIAGTLKISGNSVNRFLSRAITKIRAWRGLSAEREPGIKERHGHGLRRIER